MRTFASYIDANKEIILSLIRSFSVLHFLLFPHLKDNDARNIPKFAHAVYHKCH